MNWERLVIGLAVAIGFGVVALVIWYRRSAMSRGEAAAHVRSLGVELIRLPGRLRRVAADPRTPRRARWWLIGLAIYVASPIDPIPDFIPVVGHLDELIVVPIVLAKIRRMIPPDVWAEYFPPRAEPPPDETAHRIAGNPSPHRANLDDHRRECGNDRPSRGAGATGFAR